jgi:hypothetical protein
MQFTVRRHARSTTHSRTISTQTEDITVSENLLHARLSELVTDFSKSRETKMLKSRQAYKIVLVMLLHKPQGQLV